MKRFVLLAGASAALALSVNAQGPRKGFSTGPVFTEHGKTAPVQSDLQIPKEMKLKVAFDIAQAAEVGKTSRPFESVARFINMHAAAGIARERIQPAIVVHGPAAGDLLKPAIGEEASPTNELIEALIKQGVPIYLCGQTAAAKDIRRDELIPGVQVALSAMTAHAVLAEEGYSLNPF